MASSCRRPRTAAAAVEEEERKRRKVGLRERRFGASICITASSHHAVRESNCRLRCLRHRNASAQATWQMRPLISLPSVCTNNKQANSDERLRAEKKNERSGELSAPLFSKLPSCQVCPVPLTPRHAASKSKVVGTYHGGLEC